MSKLLPLLLLLALCSCASQGFLVQVDGLAAGGAPAADRYAIEPDQPVEDALQWAELRSCVGRTLQEQGWRSAAPDEAELVLSVAWGIGDPEEYSYQVSTPVYGKVGETTTYDSGNSYNGYTATATTTPTFGITHYESETETGVRFHRYLTLTAWPKEGPRDEPLWETRLNSTGWSGDLRQVLPVMLAAGAPYLGRSTGKRIEVSLTEQDKRVQRIAGLTR